MIEAGRTTGRDGAGLDYVPFSAAGDPAAGEYRCAECGYGISVRTTLPRCPMCAGRSWELRAGLPRLGSDS